MLQIDSKKKKICLFFLFLFVNKHEFHLKLVHIVDTLNQYLLSFFYNDFQVKIIDDQDELKHLNVVHSIFLIFLQNFDEFHPIVDLCFRLSNLSLVDLIVTKNCFIDLNISHDVVQNISYIDELDNILNINKLNNEQHLYHLMYKHDIPLFYHSFDILRFHLLINNHQLTNLNFTSKENCENL